MTFLLIYKKNQNFFEFDEILKNVKSIKGLYDIKVNDKDSTIFAQFDFNDDSTILRISKNLEHITISGIGDASAMLAFIINKNCDDKLNLVDRDYSFDLDLSLYNSFEELKDKMII